MDQRRDGEINFAQLGMVNSQMVPIVSRQIRVVQAMSRESEPNSFSQRKPYPVFLASPPRRELLCGIVDELFTGLVILQGHAGTCDSATHSPCFIPGALFSQLLAVGDFRFRFSFVYV